MSKSTLDLPDCPVRAPVSGQNAGTSRRSASAWGWRAWLVAIPLALITFAAFLPTLNCSFVAWDDPKNFFENPFYRGLGVAQWKWAWSTCWLGVYQPLTWLTFGAQYVVWKLDPHGYHLTSLVLHTVNAVVLYGLTLALLRRCQQDCCLKRPWTCVLAAGLAAALFAAHPLRVEPVAWISCQPYLPCALFSMLAVLAYLRAFETVPSPRWGWLVGSLVLFIAALLFHAVAVSLPVVLLILDVYPLRRFGDGPGRLYGQAARQVYWQKVPFLIVSLVFMCVAVVARQDALSSIEQTGPMTSLARACYATWFYLFKTALPLNIIAVYPAPKEISWRAPLFLSSILGTLAMSLGSFLLRRRWPGLMAAWLSYLAILAPNSGIIRTDDQLAADRYSYLSTMGWVVVAAAVLCWRGAAKSRSRPRIDGMMSLGVGALLVLAMMTWQQCRTWQDSETLWTHAMTHGAGSSSLAHYNLGIVYHHQGRFAAALAQYAEALRLNPRGAQAHNNVGVILQLQGKLDAAAAQYAEAQRCDPDYVDAHYNLGLVLSRQGKFAAAAAQYAEALRLNPGLAAPHDNLGADLSRQGQHELAAAQFAEALRLNPDDVEARKNLELELSLTRKDMSAEPR